MQLYHKTLSFPSDSPLCVLTSELQLSEHKVKAKLFLCLTKHRAMQTCGREDVCHTFLTSALDGGEWSASRFARFTPGIHCIGFWMVHRAGLDAVPRRTVSVNDLSHAVPCQRVEGLTYCGLDGRGFYSRQGIFTSPQHQIPLVFIHPHI